MCSGLICGSLTCPTSFPNSGLFPLARLTEPTRRSGWWFIGNLFWPAFAMTPRTPDCSSAISSPNWQRMSYAGTRTTSTRITPESDGPSTRRALVRTVGLSGTVVR